VREDDRQVVEDKTENVGLHVDGKKSKKRKVGSASGTSTGIKKAKKIKDPNAPKRPATAFMIFSTQEKCKDDLGDNLSFGEKGKEIGRRWQALAPEEKQVYHEKYRELKVEFDNAMKDYTPSEEFLTMKKQAEKEMKNTGYKPKNEPFPDAAQYFDFVSDNWMVAAQYVSYWRDSFGILDIEDRLHVMFEQRQSQSKDENSGKSKTKLVKKQKDPNAPKKAMSAYMFYCTNNRETMKTNFPDISNKELLAKIGESWRLMAGDDKQVYHDKAMADKDRYAREYREYMKNVQGKKEDVEIVEPGCGVLE